MCDAVQISIRKRYNYVKQASACIENPAPIMKNVMAYAAEAEFGTKKLNGQESVPIRTTLEEMKWPQAAE